MSSSFFYLGFDPIQASSNLIKALKKYAGINKIQVYVLNSPLVDSKYTYNSKGAIVVLVPKHKIMILNFGDHEDDFEEFYEDFIEDLGSLSDKYNYKNIVGRTRSWRMNLIYTSGPIVNGDDVSIKDLLKANEIESPLEQKKCELLISLLTGSINDIERIKDDIPNNILDRIKQKILLFDGDQTRFVYSKTTKNKITIQGLSGTGKTELLLHKLKEIYTNESKSKVMFTCHNKILASTLRTRIPDFFNFMKVEEQIKWKERLWCEHAWGSLRDESSGAYRYICYKYNIPFYAFSYSMPFSRACQLAIDEILKNSLAETIKAFDYVLIDESQDFPDEFIKLCTMVTSKTVYVAGDIFQSIFDVNVVNEVNPDYLLSKCYRTDPRTLMFSHGLGMGLFEDEKLRWLSDNEWEQCGYIVNKDSQQNYILKREPLRRFDDLIANNITSMEIVKTNERDPECYPHNKIIQIIRKIISDHPTVEPEDIGIIFIGGNKFGYQLADSLEYLLRNEFKWGINKAYDTKKKEQPGSVFISNKNNVKGLEFPFVICIIDYLSSQKHERNALYMTLTRSFIQSFLLVDTTLNEDKLAKIEKGLQDINQHGYMLITPPAEALKASISARIDFDGKSQSVYDLVYSVFDDLDVPPLFRDPMFNLVKAMNPEDMSFESVSELVSMNIEKMKISK